MGDRDQFVRRFGHVFESSGYLAERVHERFGCSASNAEQLTEQFLQVLEAASDNEKLALLRAHPELACARARLDELTEESRKEQAGAGLDSCTDEEYEEFVALNGQYRSKFGFPFIVAVKGLDRSAILSLFRQRVRNDTAAEFGTALQQVARIARFRIEEAMQTNDSQSLINLAEPSQGGAVIRVTDDFFAQAKRMLQAQEPQFFPDLYDEHGKWMDGWESRRKRDPGHDHCIVRICPGTVYGIEVDTRHFTGNYAPAASIEACSVAVDPDHETVWTELVPSTPLGADQQHFLPVYERANWTHLRLNIFPDGGIARFRVYGRAERNLKEFVGQLVNLANGELGARALHCNDMHYGNIENILKENQSESMADGWETRRRRNPGNDWAVIKLARPGVIRSVEVDTAFFKGNNPASCSIRGLLAGDECPADLHDSQNWPVLLPRVALGPDQVQCFAREVSDLGAVSHVRLDIFPDGGIARLRLFGEDLS